VTARDDYPDLDLGRALDEIDDLRAAGDRLAALLRSGEREYASVALAEWDRLRGRET
jgi:hypothetical protein